MQLNGEVTSLKLAVPQLSAVAAHKEQQGITMNALAGAYGPEIAALAEEAQRAAVRAEVRGCFYDQLSCVFLVTLG